MAVGAALALVAWRARAPQPKALLPSGPPPLAPLAIVPPGPAFVLSVDLKRLRASPAGRALLGRGLFELTGQPCQGQLAGDVDEVVLALPAESKPGRAGAEGFGLIAAGRFQGSAVAACAAQQIRARHGDPVQTRIGSFASVRDRHQTAEVSARDGLLVVSEGAYLRELLDGAEGQRGEGSEAERARDSLHAELRRVFATDSPVSATLALPNGWLSQALGEPGAELSPLSAARSAALRNARSDLQTLLPEAAALLGRITFTRKGARIDFSAHLRAEELGKLSLSITPSASASAR